MGWIKPIGAESDADLPELPGGSRPQISEVVGGGPKDSLFLPFECKLTDTQGQAVKLVRTRDGG
jgi:hypothetical protein